MPKSLWGALVLVAVILLPSSARAQASIAGAARDSSGAALPGVTVEASSPVLIEKARTTVTDDRGLFRIVNLPPGQSFNPAVTAGSQAWLAPLSVLTPRFVKIGAQIDF